MATVNGISRTGDGMIEFPEARVWRENDRIRRRDSTGYGDMVPSDQIRDHIRVQYETHGYLDEGSLLGAAVLEIRRIEASR